jgi:hypothetical protein
MYIFYFLEYFTSLLKTLTYAVSDSDKLKSTIFFLLSDLLTFFEVEQLWITIATNVNTKNFFILKGFYFDYYTLIFFRYLTDFLIKDTTIGVYYPNLKC